MKLGLSLSFVLLLAASSAMAADRQPDAGAASLLFTSSRANGFQNLRVRDTGSALIGVTGGILNLKRQDGGFKGFALGRFLDLRCFEKECVDRGPTQLELKLLRTETGYELKGMLNFVPVFAKVTADEVELSVGVARTNLRLTRSRDGFYSGSGSVLRNRFNDFVNLTYEGTGSLAAGLQDPATLIVLVLNPLVP